MATLPLRPPVHAAAHLRHYEVIRATKQGIKLPAIRRRQQSMRRPTPTISAAAATAAGGRVTDDAGSIQGKDERSTGGGGEYKTTDEIKAALYQSLQGINRGIFGITSAKRSEIVGLVEMLESQNPTPQPTDNLLDTVDGCWKLVYSTVSILGAKRTKLGLRDFIALGDFFQIIDVEKEKATNVIKFNVRGLKMLNGQLTIEASFKIASKTRVDIKLDNSSITPDQLMEVFRKNYNVLLAIFNPEGWLEISYVDDFMRIGRDDKGNIFVLERAELEKV